MKMKACRLYILWSLTFLMSVLAGSLPAGEIPEAEMLFTPEQQREAGIERQRKMYPADVSERVGMRACLDGFRLLFKEKKPDEAMAEFNRAWRFSPNQHGAWWGAGIILGHQASEKGLPSEKRIRYLQDSMKLLEKAVELAPDEEKVNAQCDYVQSCNRYGGYLLSTGKTVEGRAILESGEKSIADLSKTHPQNGRIHYQYALNAFYSGKFILAKYEIAAAERNGFQVAPDFKAEVNKRAGSHVQTEKKP